jgi:DNA-directed RNA polymerase specialized sigma24 family protein
MSSDESVTFWIGQLKGGDAQAAQKLWEGYFSRLVGLARSKLRGAQRRVADEEDVALSAFDSFCRGAERNRFPKLSDRDDLWQLLMMITARKAIDLRQHENRKKRGGGVAPVGTGPASEGAEEDLLHQVVGREPTPEFAAQVAEECERLLDGLDDPELKQIALAKMEGYTNDEIAERMGCVVRTVERKCRLIRSLLWSQSDGS